MGRTFHGDNRRGRSRPTPTDLRDRMADFVAQRPTADLEDFIAALAAEGDRPAGDSATLRAVWDEVRADVLDECRY